MKVEIGDIFLMASDMNSPPQLQLEFEFKPPPLIGPKYTATSLIHLISISDLLLAKCGAECTLLPPREQVFLMHLGIFSN
jgi:hypothetical protein